MGSVSAEVARDRDQKAWVLRTQRFMTVYQIAAELGVDVSTVSRSLKRQGERITKELAATLEAQKAEQSMQIDMIVAAAREGWERSKEDAVEQSTREKAIAKQPDKGTARDGGDSGLGFTFDPEDVPGGIYIDENGDEIEPEERARRIADHAVNHSKSEPGEDTKIIEQITAAKRKGQVGDARFLSVALNGLAAKRAIWGLDAPKPEAGTVPMVVKVYQGVDVRELVKGNLPPGSFAEQRPVQATARELPAVSVEFSEEAEADDY